MSRSLLRSLGIAVVAAVAAGCGSGSGGDGGDAQVVASAGDVNVTLAEFHAAYNKITPNYRPDISTLEGRRSFANDLLNKEILLAEGERMGGITDPDMQNAIQRTVESRMLAELYREEVESKVDVLGKDVADVYEKRKFNIKMKHIMLPDMERAREVHRQIESGAISFEDAARKYSIDRASAPAGGDMGEVLWTMNQPQFRERAFELEPGTISEPFETDLGAHIVWTTERVHPELPSLEEMRPALRTDVRRQMEAIRMQEFVTELETKAGLTWNDEGLELLKQLIDDKQDQEIDTIPPALQYLPTPTEEQSAHALVSTDDASWTVGDYVEFLGQRPPTMRPIGPIPMGALRQLVRQTLVQNELLVAEAKARGLDQRPDVLDEADRLRERLLVEMVHQRFIQAADVTPEQAKALYDSTVAENPDQMMLPERVDMVMLIQNDEASVRESLRRIRGGEPEAEVIAEVSLDQRSRANGGRTGLMGRGNYPPQIEDVAFSRNPGSGWSDPIVAQSGAAAVRVVERESPRMATFDEMRDVIISNLAMARGEEAFEKWLNEQRDARGAKVHDDVLELIGQPVS